MNKNKMLHIIFLTLQFLTIITSVISVNQNIYLFIKSITILYEVYYLLIIAKDKNQKNNIIYFISLFTISIIYMKYFDNNSGKDITNYLYFPITLAFILKFYKNTEFKKINILNSLILLTVPLSIISILFKNYLSIDLTFIIASSLIITFPLTFIYFDKKITLLNLILIIINILGILSLNNNLLIIMLLTALIFLFFFYLLKLKEKKCKILVILLLIIFSLFYIENNFTNTFFSNLFIVNFFFYKTNKLLLNIIGIVLYLVPLILIILKVFKLLEKLNKVSDLNIISLLIAIINSVVILIFNGLTLPTLAIIITGYILILLEANLISHNKKIDKNKVTIMALHLGYGGIEQYISSLCKMLITKYDIEIISTYKVLEKPAFYFSENIKINYLMDYSPNKEALKKVFKEKNILKIIKELTKSLTIIYKKKYYNIEKIEDINSKYIITTRDFHNDLVGCYAREGIIKIATEHNYHNNDGKYIKKIIKSVARVDYFVLVSETLKNFYADKVKPKCFYIPNVLDELPNKKTTCQKHNLISVGRLSKEKGQKDLIDVVKLLKEEYKDIILYLIGDGEEREDIKNYIETNNLSKNVILTGFLSKNDIELKMLDSCIFVTTSYTESFGLVVLEACSYNIPVVAFDSATGVKKLLEHGNGVLVANRDKKEMKQEIKRLFEDSKYREKIANSGYNNCKKYLGENISKEWFSLLK